jgi:hypothetical protein
MLPDNNKAASTLTMNRNRILRKANSLRLSQQIDDNNNTAESAVANRSSLNENLLVRTTNNDLTMVDLHREQLATEQRAVKLLRSQSETLDVVNSRSLSLPRSSTISNDENEDDDFIEIFDPSLIFIAVHKCYYWDSKDRIRKGKIYLTSREMLFKCSRMPFVKVRIDLREIVDVVKIKNYKHKFKTVLSIETSGGRSYAFYRFRLPSNVVKSIILQVVNETKANELEASLSGATNTDNESLNSNVLRLKKMSHPLHNFASIIRTSLSGTTNNVATTTTTTTTTSKSNTNSSNEDEDEVVTKSESTPPPPPMPKTLRLLKQNSVDNVKENKMSRYQKNWKKSLKKVLALKKEEIVTTTRIETENYSAGVTTIEQTSVSVQEEMIRTQGEQEEDDGIDDAFIEDTRTIVQRSEMVQMEQISSKFLMKKSSSSEMPTNLNNSNNTIILLFLMFLSLLAFLILTINNFVKLSLIERQISSYV